MATVSADLAYLFRHPLLREAAYQLQLPSSRARLHAHALAIMERSFGAHDLAAAESLGAELADHAAGAQASKSLKKDARKQLAAAEIRHRLAAASHAVKNSDLNGAVAQYEKIKQHPLASPTDAATARWHLGVRLMALGKMEAARDNLEDACRRTHELGDAAMHTSVELELGNLESALGRIEIAREIYSRSLSAARSLQAPKLESVARGGLAGLCYRCADYAAAALGYREALAASERANDATNIAINQMNLANTLFQLDSVSEALEMLRALCRRLVNSPLARLRGVALSNLANFLEDAGLAAEAQQVLAEAEEISTRIGTAQLAPQNMDVHARIEMRAGNWQAALLWLERGIHAARETGKRLEGARCAARRAIVLAKLGDISQAQSQWDEAVAQYAAVGSREYAASMESQFAEAMAIQRVTPK